MRIQIQWRLGALEEFSPANPTGSYVLNLSTDVDHSLAARLLTCWAVETRQGLCKASDLQSCWRNIHLDGIFLDCFTIDPLVYDLPNRGVLSLDYVSYDVPTTAHADLFARLQTLRSEVFRIKRPPLWVMTGDTPLHYSVRRQLCSPGPRGAQVERQRPQGETASAQLVKAALPERAFQETEASKLKIKVQKEREVWPELQVKITRLRAQIPKKCSRSVRKMARGSWRCTHRSCCPDLKLSISSIAVEIRIGRTLRLRISLKKRFGPLTPLFSRGQFLALFRNISAGKITDTTDIRAVLMQYTHAVPDAVCEQTAEELKLVRMVLTAQKAQKKEAARRATEVVAADGSGLVASGAKEPPPALDVVASSESAGAGAGEVPDASKKDKKDKKKKASAGDAAEGSAGFPQGPAQGIPVRNAASAIAVLRMLACDYHVTAEQVDLIIELFDEVSHKVKVFQTFWARIINRSRIPHVLRCIPRDAQIQLGHKLGWRNVMSLQSPDAAYELDLARPDDNDLGTKLFRLAVDVRGRCVNNLLVDGKPHIIKEENFLLFGVVEEKALKAKSTVITFDFWSMRRNVLQDREFNAALIIQQTWSTFRERRKRHMRRSRSANRQSQAASKFATASVAAKPFFRRDVAETILETTERIPPDYSDGPGVTSLGVAPLNLNSGLNLNSESAEEEAKLESLLAATVSALS